jgi:hypothetical protein
MFDITSSLKKFFITEDTSVEPVFNQSSLQATSKDALYKAPKTQEIDFSYTPLDFVAKASSCHHPYYFFEQKKNSVAPNYLMQETASSETAAAFSATIVKTLGDLVHGEGLCKQSQTGLVYLDISSDYIVDLAPFFVDEGGIAPQFQAHIAIISSEEAMTTGISIEEDYGAKLAFSIIGCDQVVTKNWRGIEKVWILKVYSEELEALRKKFGLCPRMRGKAFHILVSLKPSSKKQPPVDFFRVSPTACGV